MSKKHSEPPIRQLINDPTVQALMGGIIMDSMQSTLHGTTPKTPKQLLEEALKATEPSTPEAIRKALSDDLVEGLKRNDYVRLYSWAQPNEAAIAAIAKLSPIIEIGAGTGFWAKQLADHGADILAFDLLPPDTHRNKYHGRRKVHYPIKQGNGPEVIKEHTERALMLCWPPLGTTMAYDTIRRYQGDKIIYIGEGMGGCTGDDQFHDLLAKDWNLVKRVDIPNWKRFNDTVHIYERK